MPGSDLGGQALRKQTGPGLVRLLPSITRLWEKHNVVSRVLESFLKPNDTDDPRARVYSNLEAQSACQEGVWSCGWGGPEQRNHITTKAKRSYAVVGGGDQSHSPGAGLDMGIKQFRFWIRVGQAVGCSGPQGSWVSRAERRSFCPWICFARSGVRSQEHFFSLGSDEGDLFVGVCESTKRNGV